MPDNNYSKSKDAFISYARTVPALKNFGSLQVNTGDWLFKIRHTKRCRKFTI